MSSPAAWHTDPTGKHDHRWWDGTKWTEHVADAGESKIDHLAPGDMPAAPGGDTATSDTATSDTVAMGTSAGATGGETAGGDAQGDQTGHTDPGTGGLSGAWEGSADPQPSQPGGHDATAQQPAWQQGQSYGQGGDPYAQQQPAWDANAAYVQSAGGTDGVAVAALVIGILSLLTSIFVIGGLGGIIALVLGLVALGRIKRNRTGGRGMAITGIVTGVLSIIVAILVLVFSVSLFGGFFSDYEQCMQENDDQALCQQRLEEGIMDRLGN